MDEIKKVIIQLHAAHRADDMQEVVRLDKIYRSLTLERLRLQKVRISNKLVIDKPYKQEKQVKLV